MVSPSLGTAFSAAESSSSVSSALPFISPASVFFSSSVFFSKSCFSFSSAVSSSFLPVSLVSLASSWLISSGSGVILFPDSCGLSGSAWMSTDSLTASTSGSADISAGVESCIADPDLITCSDAGDPGGEAVGDSFKSCLGAGIFSISASSLPSCLGALSFTCAGLAEAKLELDVCGWIRTAGSPSSSELSDWSFGAAEEFELGLTPEWATTSDWACIMGVDASSSRSRDLSAKFLGVLPAEDWWDHISALSSIPCWRNSTTEVFPRDCVDLGVLVPDRFRDDEASSGWTGVPPRDPLPSDRAERGVPATDDLWDRLGVLE